MAKALIHVMALDYVLANLISSAKHAMDASQGTLTFHVVRDAIVMPMDQIMLHVTVKENVLARRLILLVKSVINVVLESMGFQIVKTVSVMKKDLMLLLVVIKMESVSAS